VGAFADLVIFDPATVIDHSTFEKPQELPVGIQSAFVNGQLVWNLGKPTGARPGVVITH
jgi:N-acyl-D-amino-acid deacylase